MKNIKTTSKFEKMGDVHTVSTGKINIHIISVAMT